MGRASLTVALAWVLAACAPSSTSPGDRDAEIGALAEHVVSIVPSDWEQVGDPLVNGAGCDLRDCVRYSVVLDPGDSAPTCQDITELLAAAGPAEPPVTDADSCGAIATIDGAVR